MAQKEDELLKKRPRILIIDDDAAICDMLRVYFNKSGFEVEAYVDPFVARHRLEAAGFDVVITDMMMEKMTGAQITRLIKRISPETRVIMISYMPKADHLIESVREDLFDYLPKPVDLKALHATVEKALTERVMI